MADDVTQDDIRKLEDKIKKLDARIKTLEKDASDALTLATNASSAGYVTMKNVQPAVDSIYNELDKRLKVVEGKTKHLK
jgi:hypothetical protein